MSGVMMTALSGTKVAEGGQDVGKLAVAPRARGCDDRLAERCRGNPVHRLGEPTFVTEAGGLQDAGTGGQTRRSTLCDS